MTKTVDAYVAGLSDWQAEAVTALRRDILAAGGVTEAFKWGHPVYDAGGPVCLIKAYPGHVTFAFWRGAELGDKRFEPSGGADMASMKLKAAGEIKAADVKKLVAAAVALNKKKGDPLKKAK